MRFHPTVRLFFSLLFVFLFSGCSTISNYRDAALLKSGYVSKTKAESELAKVRVEFDAKLAENSKLTAATQEKLIKDITTKMQFGANALYGGNFAFLLHPNPDRTHIIMDNKINEAAAVLPPPTIEAMTAQNTEVKRQLDEVATSLAQLKAEHEVTLKEAAATNAVAEKTRVDLEKVKQDKVELETAKNREIESKQSALNEANDKVISAEHERGDDAKARHELLTKLSMGAGLLAALCAAGAIWSPVFKSQLGIAAGVFAVAAVGVWYLTGPVVLAIVGGGGLIAVAWAALNHHKEATVSTDLMRAVQRVKENAPEEYEKVLKPELEEANMKYVKKDGVLTKVIDPTRAAFIDARLAQVGDK